MPTPQEVRDYLDERLTDYPGVPGAVAHRMLNTESGGDVNAVSPKGAIGPMQLMPGTAKDLGVDPTDWKQNIDGGLRYLDQNIKRFKGNVPLGVAAYHAGPGAVERAGGVPDTSDGIMKTSEYVHRIAPGKTINDAGDTVDAAPASAPASEPATTPLPKHWVPLGFADAPPPTDTSSSIVSDSAKAIGSGVTQAGAVVGKGLQMAGATDLGQSVQDYWNEATQKLVSSMSPEAAKALQSPILNDDFSLGDTPVASAYYGAMQMLPSLAVMGVGGKVAMAGLDAVAGATRLASILQRSGVAADAAKSVAARVATGTAYGIPQGVYMGLQAGASAQEQVNNTSPDELATSPGFQAAYAQTSENLPDQRRAELARDIIARHVGDQVATHTMALTGAFGMLTGGGMFGKAAREGYTGGLAARAAKGAAVEQAALLPQMVGQTMIGNQAIQDNVNPDQPTMAGVPNAIAGSLSFAPIGALSGAGHARGTHAEAPVEFHQPGAPAEEEQPFTQREQPAAAEQPAEAQPAAPMQASAPNEAPLATGDIGRSKDNAPFANRRAAEFALKRTRDGSVTDSHEVVEVGDNKFVLRPRDEQTSITAPETPPEAAQNVNLTMESEKPAEAGVDAATGEVTQALAPGMQEGDIGRNSDGAPFANKPAAVQALREKAGKGLFVSKIGDDQYVLRRQEKPAAPIDEAAHEAATSPHNETPEPTQAQKEAGNYTKGHVDVGGLDISIENPQGSTRSGVSSSGKAWSTEMQSHYGYIRGTVGKDKDHVDTFIKPGTPSDYAGPVHVVDQVNPGNHAFDEHKVLIGWNTPQEARAAYLANYTKAWKGLGKLTSTDMAGFKDWLANGDTKREFAKYGTKPASSVGAAIEFSNWRDLENGYSMRESTTHPIQEIKTPDGNIISRGLQTDGKPYTDFEMGHDPLVRGGMAWVDKAKSDLESMRVPKLEAKSTIAPSVIADVPATGKRLAMRLKELGGIDMREASDTVGETGMRARRLLPGLFRNTGRATEGGPISHGHALSTLVHDGRLDAYLPPELRQQSGTADTHIDNSEREGEAVEHLRDLIRRDLSSKDVGPHDQRIERAYDEAARQQAGYNELTTEGKAVVPDIVDDATAIGRRMSDDEVEKWLAGETGEAAAGGAGEGQGRGEKAPEAEAASLERKAAEDDEHPLSPEARDEAAGKAADEGPLFSRTGKVDDGAHQRVADFYRSIAKHSTAFRYGRSEAKDVATIAHDMHDNLHVTEDGVRKGEFWIVSKPTGNHALLRVKDGKVELDLSGMEDHDAEGNPTWFGRGKGGSAIYQVAQTFAKNNGLKFIGDTQGISRSGMRRRTEMLSSAILRAGTSDHVAPHDDQVSPVLARELGFRPMDWRHGQHDHNLAEALLTSADYVYRALPELRDLRYDFSRGEFVDDVTGREVSPDYLQELAISDAARAVDAGRATIARAVVTQSLVRGTGPSERHAVLGEPHVRDGKPLPESLERILYSRSDEARESGLSVSEVQKHVAPAIEKWTGGPKVEVVQSVKDLPTHGAPDDARGAYIGGKAYLVADNLTGAKDAQFTLFHETFHDSVDTVPGVAEGLQRIFNQNQNVRSAAAKWRNENERGSLSAKQYQLRAINEALADLGSRSQSITGLDKLMATLQKGLRAIGLDHVADWLEKHTDAEALKFVSDAIKHATTEDVPRFTAGESPAFSSKDDGPTRPYETAPNSLMGFRRNGPQKGYDETNYPHEQGVRVHWENGDTIDEAMKGMNKAHAMERARRNWPDAKRIDALDEVPQFSRADAIPGAGPVTRSDLTERLTQMFRDTTRSDKTFNWWHKGPGTQFHKAEVEPSYKPVYEKARAYEQDTSQFAMDAADRAPDILPRLSNFRDIFKKGPSAADMTVVSDAIHAGTLQDKTRYTRDEARARGMNDKQWGLYNQAMDAFHRSLDDLAASEAHRLMRMHDMPMEFSDRAKANPEDARSIYLSSLDPALERAKESLQHAQDYRERTLKDLDAEAVKSLDSLDPVARARESKDLTRRREGIAADLDTNVQKAEERYDAVQTTRGDLMSMFDKIARLKREGYAPLKRFGNFTVHATDEEGKTRYFHMDETQRGANELARALHDLHPEWDITQGIKSEKGFELMHGLSPDALEVFAHALGAEKSDVFQDYLKMAISDRSTMKQLLRRKGTPGFDTDIARNLSTFVTAMGRGAARNYHFADMLEKAAQIPREKGDVIDEAVKLINYMRNPQKEAPVVRNLMFMNYLGGSVASALTNATQPIMQTMPYLAKWGGSKAVGAMKRAMPIALGGLIKDDALRAAMARADKEGVTSPHELHQLYAESIRGFGSNMAVRKFTKVWGSFFSLAEQFNRKITFAAAFDMAKSMSPEDLSKANVGDAYAFARKAVDETQGVYARSNRPQWARGPVGAVLMTFKQFSIQYLEFLQRLPPQQKALALSTLVAASGVQGLPFAGDLEDIIDTLGQSMGFNTNSKEALRHFAVKTLGSTLGDVALRGVTAVPGSPIDMQARLGLGNLIPGSSLLKRSEKDKTKDIAEFFGPAGSTFQTLLAAQDKAQAGDYKGALLSAAPIAVQNAVKGLEMAQSGVYKNQKGQKIVDATKTDALFKALGLSPYTVGVANTRVEGVRQDIAMAKQVQGDILDKLAEARADGDAAAEAKARQEISDWNNRNPDSRISINPAALNSRVRQMRTERDVRVGKQAPKAMRAQVQQDLRSTD